MLVVPPFPCRPSVVYSDGTIPSGLLGGSLRNGGGDDKGWGMTSSGVISHRLLWTITVVDVCYLFDVSFAIIPAIYLVRPSPRPPWENSALVRTARDVVSAIFRTIDFAGSFSDCL